MTNFLSLSTGTTNAAVARVAPISGVTPAASRTRMTFSGLVRAYSALSMTQKGGWQTVANTLNRSEGRVGQHKISPANAFLTLNSALLASGQDILSDAPDDLSAPPVLPAVTVHSTVPGLALTGNSPIIGGQGAVGVAFTLTLVSPGYDNAVHILASPPAPAGKNTFPDNTFKAIGFLPSLPAGQPADISALYAAAFGFPELGSQVALKLIATSDTGIRLSPLVLAGVVIATH